MIHPASTTHSQLTENELLDQGIKPNTIRLSIGTEHIDDILNDLEQGFSGGFRGVIKGLHGLLFGEKKRLWGFLK